ncbi:hypothetical protein NQ317_017320 [Molorchus minor]|uniref:Kinesin-like protein n=1 Tax=Molorchus minor TaxID=1323400 RepID=A0ABQ9K0N6_9CUCU|nr:hypothetical protein NQ317_017320 [Molorchus minor]
MAENVKVIVRCRPMNKKEIDLNCKSVLEGYNATIFVYGQTGCGKSYTMEGVKTADGAEKGVISRAFEHIFEAISVTSGVKYLALISYLEIYNEQIRDLLIPTEKLTTTSALNLKESPNEGITVPGLTTYPVHNAAECEHFLNVGSKNRMIGATLMNQNSSRSHSIFTISIEQISNVNNNESVRKGKLNLVDLAGSERQAKTGATGDRLKEATKINLSLSALGNVISALVDGKAKHIPYRDSKLTRLLQDSLGGNTRTLMIACISPSSRDYIETLSTLRYANRAKNIHNKPKVNEDPKDAIVRQYQQEIEKLKILLQNKQHLKIEDLTEIRDKHKKELCSKEEILKRIEVLKAAMIGGEKADDRELSERRKRKKMAAERRASVIAHLLAKIEMNEDREILQNQYKDISQELNLKTEALRKYRHKVKSLEKEISDIQSEFETDRQDYLESIRRQDRNIKLLTQISEKLSSTLKKECNYRYVSHAGRSFDIQTAPGRLQYESESYEDENSNKDFLTKFVNNLALNQRQNYSRISSTESSCSRTGMSSPYFYNEEQKLDRSEKEDIIASYFQPTMKRANELLSQSSRLDPCKVFNTWRGKF